MFRLAQQRPAFVGLIKRKNQFANISSVTSEQRTKFLLDKKIMDSFPTRRDEEILFLNRPDLAPMKMQAHYTKCQQRLNRVLSSTRDLTKNAIPTDVQTFEQFYSKYPVWNDPSKSFVFHRDHKMVSNKAGVLEQRAQLSGLCYIHGPDMVQHYCVSMHTPESAGMIDISKMIRETFDAKELEKHIFDDVGGNSWIMLKRILQPKSIVFASHITMYAEDLKQYGTGLVSLFEVHPEFLDMHVHSHAGTPTTKHEGLHAMALIGARVDDTGKRWFLLQNWWKAKQFVEVDEEYMEAAGATVYFVKTPQLAIPTEFPINYASYVENENYLDKSDYYTMLEYKS